MRIIISFCILLLCSALSSQNFYDINTIQKIEIQFSQSNWDYQMDTAKSGSEGYIIAASVTVNGVQFDSVGVKYKGNSSYNANNNKNPMHISLDYIHGNNSYYGYDEIKLGNCFSDPSMFREVLAYNILSQYMDCPKSNFAQVYINGVLRGLYNSSESINKKFVSEHFYSSGNSMFKCNPSSVMTYQPDLLYYGTDSANYYNRYEIKSSIKWKDLVNLCDTMNNNFTNIENSLDIDRALWMLSFNNVLVNLDSYTGQFRQNYYLYMDNTNRFVPVVWDLNMSFGGFNMSGSGGSLNVSGMQNMSPVLHSTDAGWPLIKNSLSNARYKKMYIAHMRTINSENFYNGNYQTLATNFSSIIDTAVQSDPYKFFTYTQFQNCMSTSVTSGPMTIPGITALMGTRSTYLSGTTEFTAVPPVISAITNNPSAPAYNSTVTINAMVTNTNYVYLGYRYNLSDRFTKLQMFDDGAHGDGAAADNIFGASVTVSSAQIEYYIYAENANAGMFSPERAEHEFYTLNATVTMAAQGDVVINEFMASNTSTQADPGGGFADWIELYNNTSNAISLGTLYLSDNYSIPQKWSFPVNASIAGNGFLIVWADQDTTQNGIHSNFKLAASGESLIMSYANGTVLDSLSFGTQTADVSYGRYPNGTGPFVVMPPTYNAVNSLAGIGFAEQVKDKTFSLWPNPTNGAFSINGNLGEIKSVEVFNATGQSVFAQSGINSFSMNVQLTNVEKGMYFVRINNEKSYKLIIE